MSDAGYAPRSGCCSAPRTTGRARSRRWSRRLGAVPDGAGGRHAFDVERVTIEPFNLREQAAPRRSSSTGWPTGTTTRASG